MRVELHHHVSRSACNRAVLITLSRIVGDAAKAASTALVKAAPPVAMS
jgi:hypothetical protein